MIRKFHTVTIVVIPNNFDQSIDTPEIYTTIFDNERQALLHIQDFLHHRCDIWTLEDVENFVDKRGDDDTIYTYDNDGQAVYCTMSTYFA